MHTREMMMKYLTMNNGFLIPVLGTGTNTFGKKNNDFGGEITFDTKELVSTFSHGYRLIDTAIYYRNEAVIGKAVKESTIPREEFFITSKIPEKDEFSGTDDLVLMHVNASLKAIAIVDDALSRNLNDKTKNGYPGRKMRILKKMAAVK
jgi:diketogulonate reductase-like aldo/keto reductase